MLLGEKGFVTLGEETVAYAIERSKRRRRTIGLMLGDKGEIRVLAPARTAFGAIESLIRRQQNWIRRRLREVETKRHQHAQHQLSNGSTVFFQGKEYKLEITYDVAAPPRCGIEGEVLKLHFSESLTPVLDDNDQEIRLELRLWYKKQARSIFASRMQFWAEELALPYRSCAVSNPKRLWGSCSGRNDIRLNWRLIMAPLALLDYVIVHELCHIKQKNHSARFWALVEAALPDYLSRRKELRRMTSLLDC